MTSANYLLVICRSTPYGKSNAMDSLDMAFTAAAYEVPLQLAFIEDGVYQCLREQNTEVAGLSQKNIAKVLTACESYDIKNLFVDSDALLHRQLSPSDLIANCMPCSKQELQVKMSEAKYLIML